MNRVTIACLGALTLLLSGASPASAQTWGRPRVPSSGACFYEHIDFGGRYFCSRAGETRDSVPRGTNDEISSIRVFGGAEVEVFRDPDFRGSSRRFESDVRDLRRTGWNDRISSFRVDDRRFGRGNGGGPVWGRPSVPQVGACFYEHINFEGEYFCVRRGTSLAEVPRGTNDRISSIRLFGDAGVIVYRDNNFDGSSRRFEDDIRDLRRSGWNDRISSFRVDPRGNRGRPRDRNP
jgi:hypothetical protein